MSTTVLADVVVAGVPTSVLLRDDRIAAVGVDSWPRDATVIDGARGALLPGLHDHHVHLLSMAARWEGVDCSTHGGDIEGLVEELRRSPATWIRATGYHESQAGDLDRDVLDAWVPDRPLRVQHRSGALWILNSPALALVDHALDHSSDVERDAAGVPNGRLWRYDARLRPAIDATAPDVGRVSHDLVRRGLTGLTDATPDLDARGVALLRAAQATGALPQRLVLLGPDDHIDTPDLLTGPRKIMVRDHDLPTVHDLTAAVRHWHGLGRPVAVHVVTSESLVLTLAAIEAAGQIEGDRIEHAAVVPPGMESWLARLGVTVVTQPDFLRTRGDSYLRDVDESERPFLYRYRSLQLAGVPVAASSDAPFGEADPWTVMASARDRRTRDGQLVGRDERVPVATALASYLSPPSAPGGPPRSVAPQAAADLCLLHGDLDEALREPHADRVRLTVTARLGSHQLHD